MRRKSALLHIPFPMPVKSSGKRPCERGPLLALSFEWGGRHFSERMVSRMKKGALFLLFFLIGATPTFAQMQDRGGTGGLDSQPGIPDSNQPGTPPESAPGLGDQGGVAPCPPGSTTPDLDQGDRGGLGQPDLGPAIPNDRNPHSPGNLPPNSPGSVPPNPEGSVPPNPQGSVPNTPGMSPGDQGGGPNQPGVGNQDQLGTNDCPPSGTDRGGSNQGGGLDNRSGQDVPGSDRQTPPPLLPPSGGVQ